jgi:hypothetical protein
LRKQVQDDPSAHDDGYESIQNRDHKEAGTIRATYRGAGFSNNDAKTTLRAVGLEAVGIGAAVGIGGGNPLLVNAALRDAVRCSNCGGARKSGHCLESAAAGRFLSSYHISPSPNFSESARPYSVP